MFSAYVLLAIGLCVSESQGHRIRHEIRQFPNHFLFGTATASYQIEGAWNVDGKSENIWDHLSHQTPCVINNCDTGDVAENSYYLYKRDVEMLRELGVDFYRFSISWTRIFPTGFTDKINEAGVKYYNNLIDELLKNGIIPMLTLFHWDLPQNLQQLGGWANPHIVEWFGDYAKAAFELFGDRVKYWITINEPYQICHMGYGAKDLAPLLDSKGFGEYLCAKYLLLGHAKAYHTYNNEFRQHQGGEIFITLSAHWFEPDGEDNVEAANDSNEFNWGHYAHPIFSATGDYPPVMKERIAARSFEQGFQRSRLPEFTAEEIEYVRGTSDYFGLNHYSASYAYRNSSVEGYHASPSIFDDVGVITYNKDSGEGIVGSPWAFYKLLKSINEMYGNPPVFITENGRGNDGGLEDDDRVTYYRQYISAMLDAMDEGCDVRGYTTWSLMDNFEWLKGYSVRFGLYQVDMSSPERTRTPRKSALVYKEMLRSRCLDMHYEPNFIIH
ncbi:myrosinase 1-like isoform X2 [Pieris brassicae]|uniref:myrosinase 1-like isoform X2 n=1 Tax=Pieris brassicae TaxID=7116 RepID=UPI001E66184E|nr:myrosinase 1-like isoform X2 [Pieris brassicae]